MEELDLFDFTSFLPFQGAEDWMGTFGAFYEMGAQESTKFLPVEGEASLDLELVPSRQESTSSKNFKTGTREMKDSTLPSAEKQASTKVKGSEIVFRENEIFDCLNLDEQLPSDSQDPQPTFTTLPELVGDNPQTQPIKPDPRDETTIAKVIFTVFKKYLMSSSPINLKPYFRLCPYAKNHRTLMDFEVPYLYAERLDQTESGSLLAFQQFLKHIKPLIQQQAEQAYASNSSRLSTFISYLDRIYVAYNSGLDSRGRMRILYRTPSKLPGAMKKLEQIQARFP